MKLKTIFVTLFVFIHSKLWRLQQWLKARYSSQPKTVITLPLLASHENTLADAWYVFRDPSTYSPIPDSTAPYERFTLLASRQDEDLQAPWAGRKDETPKAD